MESTTRFYPFPFGKFTESEWKAAYGLFMNDSDASRQASFNVNCLFDPQKPTDISEVDLAYLSLVSDELSARVDAHRREMVPQWALSLDDAAIVAARDQNWLELRTQLARGLDRG